jgi:hypothetical protein
MQAIIKLTKGTYTDFANIVDIYNAEVDSGEYAPDLFYVSAKSNGTSRYDALTINGIEGASMVCDSLIGEIEHCINSMYEDGSDSDGYQVAYRAKKRLQKLMAQVLDLYPALEIEPYSRENYRSYC